MADTRTSQDRTFLLLVAVVSAAFAWILWPFFGAVFWAAILAILFMPLCRRLLKSMHGRRTPAALATEAIILLIVILPTGLVSAALLQEGVGLYERMHSGELSPSRSMQAALEHLPPWASGFLERFGFTNMASLQERLSSGLSKGLQVFVGSMFDLGQNTLDFVVSFFVMLYLLFFLLRASNCRAASRRRFRCARTYCKSLRSSSPTSCGRRSRATWSWRRCRDCSAA